MPHQTFKKTFAALVFAFFVFFGLGGVTHAAVNSVYQSACGELENRTWEGAPSPMAILCPVARFLNVLVLSAGAVFVIFVFFAAIKYAMSQGDPKALQGSQQTLTTAVIGFFVVIGVWTLLTVIKNVLGLTDNQILNPFDVLSNNLARLLEKFNISTR